MGSFKEKSQGFVIGVMVGLIVAGSFFIFKLDDYVKELKFYQTFSKPSLFKKDTDTESSSNKLPLQEEANKKKEKVKKEQIQDREAADISPNTRKNDSKEIPLDSVVAGNFHSDDIVIKKDEL